MTSRSLERGFGDFSSSRFQPRVVVVDGGRVQRVSVELHGMESDDLTSSVGDGEIVLRGEKKPYVSNEEDRCFRPERARGPLPWDMLSL